MPTVILEPVELKDVPIAPEHILRELDFILCEHCGGYGSSFKDPPHINCCTMCQGSGVLVKKEIH